LNWFLRIYYQTCIHKIGQEKRFKCFLNHSLFKMNRVRNKCYNIHEKIAPDHYLYLICNSPHPINLFFIQNWNSLKINSNKIRKFCLPFNCNFHHNSSCRCPKHNAWVVELWIVKFFWLEECCRIISCLKGYLPKYKDKRVQSNIEK